MESTSQAVATQTSQSSAMPTSVAPQSAALSGMSQQPSYQGSQISQAPVAAAPQASAQAGNPWQEAFQALSASLNTSSPSQAQVPYSAYQTPTPQANTQAQWASAPQTQQQAPYSAQATYSPQASTQAYSESEVASLLQQQAASLQQSAPAASDGYLSQISDESLEVLEHFGAEAPQLLTPTPVLLKMLLSSKFSVVSP